MKFRVERSELTDAVAWVARSLPSRATLQVLSGLLLEAASDGLRLTGSDLEVSAHARVDATVAEGGRALVSGRLLSEIARSLPAAPVELAVEGSRLVLGCGTATFRLPLLPVDDYPTLPELPEESGHVPGGAFAAAVGAVAVAAGRDDALPVLTGIRMEVEGERITLVATDRYRLAVRELAWRPTDPQIQRVALVPARTLAETARAMAGADAEVAVALGGGWRGAEETGSGAALVGFESGARRTVARLLDGEFPSYRKLLPTEADTTAAAEVDTAALVEAVNRVRLVLPRLLPVRLSFADDEVTVEAQSGDEGQAEERLPVKYSGDPLTIAFNPQFLLDGLGSLEGETCRLAFTNAQRPAVITAAHPDGGVPAGGGHLYLIMPVRLPGA